MRLDIYRSIIIAGQLVGTFSLNVDNWAEQNCTTGVMPDGHGLAG